MATLIPAGMPTPIKEMVFHKINEERTSRPRLFVMPFQIRAGQVLSETTKMFFAVLLNALPVPTSSVQVFVTASRLLFSGMDYLGAD